MKELEPAEAKHKFIKLLRKAYSGELGAALAYNGHWRSLKDPREIAEIKQIEQDELEHRKLIGEMLEELGSGPKFFTDKMIWILGNGLKYLCFIAGYHLPMAVAAWLEARNVVEYKDAARLALKAQLPQYIKDLNEMSQAEHEHELYFQGKTA
jgi:demethoxyubiquinone hydroxylase (CLK1/Coq7/Cat5 family)